ncbi:MacS family sensor histidine kinase [Auraticoccus cholistanensis]|nr:ATP-binding protein [Auraticoccus cholistanensis]
MDVPEIFRGYALVRVTALVYVLAVDAVRLPSVAHPAVLVAVMLAVSAWTAFTLWSYASPARRRTWVLVLDLVATLVLVALSPWVLGPGSEQSVVPLWTASAPMALALWRDWSWGVLAAVLVSVVDLAAMTSTEVANWGGKLGFVLLTGGLGYLVAALRRSTCERERITASAAAMAERARLSRLVHDGVLQVLALVERDAPSFGPRGLLMATAARQQEVELRRLLQSDHGEDDIDVTVADLAAVLDRHASASVTISTPAGRVLVDNEVAAELDQAVSEVLTNVARHAGPGAKAWVLLEREGEDVVVSVRDNGVGGQLEDFEDAHRRGRFGVRHSIRSRVSDLGGVATLRTAPGRGVEWEFRIPGGRAQ